METTIGRTLTAQEVIFSDRTLIATNHINGMKIWSEPDFHGLRAVVTNKHGDLYLESFCPKAEEGYALEPCIERAKAWVEEQRRRYFGPTIEEM